MNRCLRLQRIWDTGQFCGALRTSWDINMQQGRTMRLIQVTPYLHIGAVFTSSRSVSDNANALEDIINYAKNEDIRLKALMNLQ